MIKKLKTWTIGSLSEQASKAAVYFMILTVCSPAEVNQYSLFIVVNNELSYAARYQIDYF